MIIREVDELKLEILKKVTELDMYLTEKTKHPLIKGTDYHYELLRLKNPFFYFITKEERELKKIMEA